MTILTLTTDFDIADGYVGVMKGVILSIAPQARLVDISHQVPPQDVRRAAYLLYTVADFFPPDTVHLVVVDPGVGTQRRPMALHTPLGYFVGPDNGVFSHLIAGAEEWTAVELADPAYRLPHVSNTFHGRDIFSPAAAHLAAGLALEKLGPPIADPVMLPLPHLEVGPERVEGEVLYTDRFGNIITSIGRLAWVGDELLLTPAFHPTLSPHRVPAAARVELAGRRIETIHRTYGLVEVGDLLALVGSEGFLEVAMRQGNAAAALGVRPGDAVALVP